VRDEYGPALGLTAAWLTAAWLTGGQDLFASLALDDADAAAGLPSGRDGALEPLVSGAQQQGGVGGELSGQSSGGRGAGEGRGEGRGSTGDARRKASRSFSDEPASEARLRARLVEGGGVAKARTGLSGRLARQLVRATPDLGAIT